MRQHGKERVWRILLLKGFAWAFFAGTFLSTVKAQETAPSILVVKKEMNALESGHPWQFEGFLYGGPAIGHQIHADIYYYDESIFFLNGGFEVGKVFLRSRQNRWYSGSGEAMVEVVPYWYGDRPQQLINYHFSQGFFHFTTQEPQRTWHGITVTPLLFRWNFSHLAKDSVTPYAQGGSGLLWTTQKFPAESPSGLTTSRINWTPQGGLGANIFVKERQSLDLSVRAVHYSSAGIGDYNPGIDITLQFGVGYSWWKR